MSRNINIIHGDLFDANPDISLAHCISQDARMGAGIAVLFQKKFKQRTQIQNMQVSVGDIAAIKVDNRYIYNLVTKSNALHKPTYENLTNSIKAMKEHAIRHYVTDIAMPKIGSGLDRLNWNVVLSIIEKTFENTNINIYIYYL